MRIINSIIIFFYLSSLSASVHFEKFKFSNSNKVINILQKYSNEKKLSNKSIKTIQEYQKISLINSIIFYSKIKKDLLFFNAEENNERIYSFFTQSTNLKIDSFDYLSNLRFGLSTWKILNKLKNLLFTNFTAKELKQLNQSIVKLGKIDPYFSSNLKINKNKTRNPIPPNKLKAISRIYKVDNDTSSLSEILWKGYRSEKDQKSKSGQSQELQKLKRECAKLLIKKNKLIYSHLDNKTLLKILKLKNNSPYKKLKKIIVSIFE